MVGTTKLHEFAFGVTGINEWDGTAANPAAPGRVPGGSSSGSAAAVAAGEADVALGTDTGGSCRIPAACCAVVGYKPSFGAVDTDGVFPLSPTLDHVGWLATDVATARRVAEALGVVPVLGDAGGGGRRRGLPRPPRRRPRPRHGCWAWPATRWTTPIPIPVRRSRWCGPRSRPPAGSWST
ncbi:MAG: amidase family protein [Acidimicrobiales bacterium]